MLPEMNEQILRLAPLLVIAFVFVIFAKVLANGFLPSFQSRPLLNKSDQRLFPLIVSALPQHCRVMCQVSYGEFLSCKSQKKFFSINAKRADFVVCDSSFRVLAVVEYQGSGHYGKTFRATLNAKRRDNQKRRALQEAGIPMIEVPAKFDVALVRDLLSGA